MAEREPEPLGRLEAVGSGGRVAAAAAGAGAAAAVALAAGGGALLIPCGGRMDVRRI